MTDYGRSLAAVTLTAFLIVGGCARAARVQTARIAPDATVLRASMQDAFMAQEIHYSHPVNTYTYASDATRLTQYQPRTGIKLTVFEGSAEGWSGMVQDEAGNACVMFVGKVSKVPTTPRGTSATKPSRSPNLDIACDN